MIHTKLLIRRLAYVPWLLAFGLVLGWAGEAQATDYPIDRTRSLRVREEKGATQIEDYSHNRRSSWTHATNVILDFGQTTRLEPAPDGMLAFGSGIKC